MFNKVGAYSNNDTALSINSTSDTEEINTYFCIDFVVSANILPPMK